MSQNRRKLKIFCEDTYGKPFFETLAMKLKQKKIIPNFSFSVTTKAANCNPKLAKFIDQSIKNGFEAIFLINDADSKVELKEKEIYNKYNSSKIKIFSLIFKTELEEIFHNYYFSSCNKKCIKPSKCLKDHKNYKKNEILNLSKKIDVLKIKEHYLIKQMIIHCNNFWALRINFTILSDFLNISIS